MLLDNRRNANKLLGCIRIFGASLGAQVDFSPRQTQAAQCADFLPYYLPSNLREQKDETCCNVQDPTEEASN